MIDRIRVVDFETTGIGEGHAICEIGQCDVVLDQNGDWQVEASSLLSSLCKPGRPIDIEARATHHISDAQVQDKEPASSLLTLMLGGAVRVFAAHKADFEQFFWKPADSQWLCTYKVAVRLWPDAPAFSNQVLRYWLGVELDERAMPPHRAGPDAFVTAHILVRELNDGRATLDDMLRWSSGPALLPKIMFGKHRGKKWEDVPIDYLDWIVAKSDMEAEIKANARYHLKKRAGAAEQAPTA